MEKKERTPIEKLFRRSLWMALPVALLTNGIVQDVARSNYYLTGGMILWGSLGATVLVIALTVLKRDELLKQKLTTKNLLLTLGCLLGTMLLTLLSLWLVTQLKILQTELNAYRESLTPFTPKTTRPPAPWGKIGLSFFYIGLWFAIPFATVLAWITIFINLLTVIWAKGVNYIDDCEWHIGRAIQAFANSPTVQANPLKEFITKSEMIRIRQTAFGGAGFFVTWLACRNGIGQIHLDKTDVLEQIRSGQLSGTNFLMYHCNAQLAERDIAPEYLEFTKLYYNHYLVDYSLWYQLHRDPGDYTYVGRWDDYLEFSKVIDENYSAYLISRGGIFENSDIVDNSPFLVWQERGMGEALIVKASWIYENALQQALAIAELPAEARLSAFKAVIHQFVRNFNILDRYNGFIETMEREEIYGVGVNLLNLARDQYSLVMTDEEFMTVFDENRDW